MLVENSPMVNAHRRTVIANIFAEFRNQFTNCSVSIYLTGTKWLTSMLDLSLDDKSPQNLVSLHVREQCRRMNMLKKTFLYSHWMEQDSHPAFSESPSPFCRTNETYSFFAVDSLLYSHFASSLGINLNNYQDLTTVAVFSNKASKMNMIDISCQWCT